MTEGWFVVSRGLTDARHDLHPQANNEPACKLGAWVDLIGYARWRDGGGLKRGELRASQRFLAARWNWSKKRVMRFLAQLEDAGRIERHPAKAPREPDRIRICNYETYQEVRPANGTADDTANDTANATKEEQEQEQVTSPVVPSMWKAWRDEMWGSDTRRSLTPTRRQKLDALYREQLTDEEDPVQMTRKIARSVLADDWWGPRDDTHVPETALRNKERREKWATKARTAPTKKLGLDAPLHRLRAS